MLQYILPPNKRGKFDFLTAWQIDRREIVVLEKISIGVVWRNMRRVMGQYIFRDGKISNAVELRRS